MTADPTLFSVDNLEVFKRHDATVGRRSTRAGCWVNLPNNWVLSVQWDAGNYGSNYHADYGDPVDDAVTAEIAAWRSGPDGTAGMVEWADGDTVQGWCPMERVQKVLDLLAEDRLVVDGVADDARSEVPS